MLLKWMNNECYWGQKNITADALLVSSNPRFASSISRSRDLNCFVICSIIIEPKPIHNQQWFKFKKSFIKVYFGWNCIFFVKENVLEWLMKQTRNTNKYDLKKEKIDISRKFNLIWLMFISFEFENQFQVSLIDNSNKFRIHWNWSGLGLVNLFLQSTLYSILFFLSKTKVSNFCFLITINFNTILIHLIIL